MPNSSNPLNLAVAALFIWMGMIAAFLGAAGLVGGDAGPMGPVFWLMTISGALMIGGGISGIRRWRRDTAAEEAARRVMLAPDPPLPAPLREAAPATESAAPAEAPRLAEAPASAPPPSVPPAGPDGFDATVLARWTYAPGEWQSYTGREIKFRTGEAVWVGIGIAVLGTLVLGPRDGEWGVAAAVSVTIAALVTGGRLLIAHSAHQGNVAAKEGGSVVITPDAVLLNGKFHVLNDEKFRFGGVRLLEDETPPILEFTVVWGTRSGPTNEQIRVPVPRGRENEARLLVDAFTTLKARA